MRYNIGLDIGIASVGFAVMEVGDDDTPLRIVRLGSRIFDTAENPKDGSSLAEPRRDARGMRRRLRRKRHRKERIRNLITAKQILTEAEMKCLFEQPVSDIYELRRDALERVLSRRELARVMLHLAQRRGFKSNRRVDSKDKEAGKMKGAIEKNCETMEKYRTVGEMLYCDERYAPRKRNKSDYLNTVTRDMVLNEARLIFAAQRDFGNACCNEEIEEKYIEILSSQRSFDEGPGMCPFRSCEKCRLDESEKCSKIRSPYAENQIESKIGFCTFEKNEKRAAKATYSFEISNLLQKVNHLRIEEPGDKRSLTEEQRIKLIGKAHESDNLNYSQIRKLLALSENQRFSTVRYSKDNNFTADEKKTKFNFLPAYHEMRKALDHVSKDRIKYISPDQRNAIGHIFSIVKYPGKDRAKIEKALANEFIAPDDISALIENMGTFRKFANLSVSALDRIIPFLEKGETYDKACESAGYDFKAHSGTEKKLLISPKHLAEEIESSISSPVVRRALSQCAKVLNAIIREMGESPVFINIELARDMAKDFTERRDIENHMESNRADNERIKKRLTDEFGLINPTGQDIIKLKLCKDQADECPYSLTKFDMSRLFEYGYAEIDHIVPRSISHNDTYANKILAKGTFQQRKGNRLPLEFLQGKERDNFIVWVNNSNLRPAKKSRLLKEQITDEDKNAFKDRALNDTRTMSRFLLNYLNDFLLFAPFETGRKRHVTAINGGTTSTLRKRWGLVKVRENGDIHHAVDAVVIACTTQKMINDISRHYDHEETRFADTSRDPRSAKEERFPGPYPFFREELMARLAPTKTQLDIAIETISPLPYPDEEIANLQPIFVSRMPQRKVGGAAHKETIKGKTEDGELVKKVSLTSLSLDKKTGEIAGYYRPDADMLLYSALKEQLLKHDGDGKKAFASDFHMPNRDRIVRKVKVLDTKSGINLRGGVAENENMVRVDVFHIANDGYYLVPIYVADTIKPDLPNKAIVAGKSHEHWKEMQDEDFIFSLYPNDLIFVRNKKIMMFNKIHSTSSLPPTQLHQETLVYYKKTGISTGSITVINHDSSYIINSLGVKTLLAFEKYQVDVLGNISRVSHEVRQPFSR